VSASPINASLSPSVEVDTPTLAVTRSCPGPSSRGIRSSSIAALMRSPDRVRALELGVRKHQRHLLATVASRDVDLAGVVPQHAGDVLEHDVPLLVPMRVVDRLEIVDVEHDPPYRMAVAPDLFGFQAEQLLESARD
jgi:hypothetical protein